MIEEQLTDSRQPPSNSYTLRGVRRIIRPRPVSKALYCTCWDGNVVIKVEADGSMRPAQINQ
jgi:hypothetical protein